MPKIAADRLEEIGRALFEAAGSAPQEAALVMRHIVGANLVGHDSHGVIQIPTYIDRIKAGHIVPGAPWVIVKEFADDDRRRRPLGVRLRRQRAGDAADHREGREEQRRRRDGVSPGPYRPAVELYADGGAGRHDRPHHRRLRALAQGGRAVRRARGAARHQPDFDGDPLRPRRRRSISTWRPRPRRPARSRSPWRAASRCRTAGSSAATASRPTIRASCARAARCCRWAARTAATRAPGSPSWSRSCAAC